MSELYGYVWMLFLLLVFGGLYWVASSRGRSRFRDFMRRSAEASEVGVANTKAVQENTAAIRDLIHKLESQKNSTP